MSAEATVRVLSKPAAPNDLTASDITTTSLTLQWTAPKSEGEDKILYTIERRAATRTGWQKVITTSEQTVEVSDLIAGTKYYFRVVAENGQGESEPSEIGPISTKEKTGKSDSFSVRYSYFLTLFQIAFSRSDDKPAEKATSVEEKKSSVRKTSTTEPSEPLTIKFEESDVAVVEGEPLKLVVKYLGSPAPTVTWYLNDEPIVASRKIKIVPNPRDGTVTLTIPSAEASNAGKFTVKAKNVNEQVTAEATIKIISKPSPPRDLAVTETTSTSVSLQWSPPKTDGGEKLKQYVIERRAATKTIWQKVTTTKEETTCTIDNLVEGTKYYIRVVAENAQGQSEPAEIGVTLKEKGIGRDHGK